VSSQQGVVVTGAGSGIGLAIAQVFLARGARVHICDVNEAALADARGIAPSLTCSRADVGDPEDAERLIEEATARLGQIDVLVNNAGIGGPAGAVDEIDVAGWDATIRVNLSGMFYCVRAVTPQMKARGAGVITNISTGSVTVALPNRTPYVASKAGVQGFTRTLARELGPFGIRCNAILPGLVDNPRGRALVGKIAEARGQTFEEAAADMLRFVSLRTWVQPEEIGKLAHFLASDDARVISGQCIGACGNIEWEE